MNDHTAEHDALIALIPEYVNERLGEADRDRVQRAAEEDPRIAAEIEVFRRLRTAVRGGNEVRASDELGWRRLQRALPARDTRPAERSPSPRWRAAAAVLAAVVLGQAIMLANAPSDRYVTAGEAAGERATYALHVAFQPGAPEGALRQLILDTGGTIVAGPSAIGLYQLQFADDTARNAALTRMRERSDIILSATLP